MDDRVPPQLQNGTEHQIPTDQNIVFRLKYERFLLTCDAFVWIKHEHLF